MSSHDFSDLENTDLYDLENESEYDPERNFLLEKVNALGYRALDIACGTGIVSDWLAGKSVEITGIDLSEDMLASARKKKFAANCDYRLMDMRDFKLEKTFPLAYLTGNAFMFLLTSRDQQKFLECVHDHLEKDGMLVLDTRPAKQSLQNLQEENFTLVNEVALTKKINSKVYYKTGYNPTAQLVKYDVKREYFVDGEYEKTEYGEVTLKLTFPIEMELLMASSGFVIEEIYATFDKDPVDPIGDKIVYVLRKKDR